MNGGWFLISMPTLQPYCRFVNYWNCQVILFFENVWRSPGKLPGLQVHESRTLWARQDALQALGDAEDHDGGQSDPRRSQRDLFFPMFPGSRLDGSILGKHGYLLQKKRCWVDQEVSARKWSNMHSAQDIAGCFSSLLAALDLQWYSSQYITIHNTHIASHCLQCGDPTVGSQPTMHRPFSQETTLTTFISKGWLNMAQHGSTTNQIWSILIHFDPIAM